MATKKDIRELLFIQTEAFNKKFDEIQCSINKFNITSEDTKNRCKNIEKDLEKKNSRIQSLERKIKEKIHKYFSSNAFSV